jgi:hypothetical protein
MELWSGKKPHIGYFKVFGCTAYALIPKADRDWKFAERARKCIFLGYPDDRRGYRLWDIEKKMIRFSRDVRFNEDKEGWSERKEEVVMNKTSERLFIDFEVEQVPTFDFSRRQEQMPGNRTQIGNEITEDTEATDVSTPEEVIEVPENVIEEEELESDSESEEDTRPVEIEYTGRELRPRTASIRPEKYSALALEDRDIRGIISF